ncbi:hypothetical protein NUW58_g8104 [Xylaria curta]|uniref:Uncharacterized protein n=1 Tax=Xylaria curta TaxID=42375 RepID=A0ACC1ND72_9PEZI|nr:hypothetical protein NUW58_g8104 [Xylaria curta]
MENPRYYRAGLMQRGSRAPNSARAPAQPFLLRAPAGDLHGPPLDFGGGVALLVKTGMVCSVWLRNGKLEDCLPTWVIDAATALPTGEKIVFLQVGGRTSCVVPSKQKKTGRVVAGIKEEEPVPETETKSKAKTKKWEEEPLF